MIVPCCQQACLQVGLGHSWSYLPHISSTLDLSPGIQKQIYCRGWKSKPPRLQAASSSALRWQNLNPEVNKPNIVLCILQSPFPGACHWTVGFCIHFPVEELAAGSSEYFMPSNTIPHNKNSFCTLLLTVSFIYIILAEAKAHNTSKCIVCTPLYKVESGELGGGAAAACLGRIFDWNVMVSKETAEYGISAKFYHWTLKLQPRKCRYTKFINYPCVFGREWLWTNAITFSNWFKTFVPISFYSWIFNTIQSPVVSVPI